MTYCNCYLYEHQHIAIKQQEKIRNSWDHETRMNVLGTDRPTNRQKEV